MAGACAELIEQYLKEDIRPLDRFPRGKVVETIKGIEYRKDGLFFEVTWVGSDGESALVASREMYKHAPQETLQFYENHVRFVDD